MVLRPVLTHIDQDDDPICPCLLVIGLSLAGIEASLALSEAGKCSLTLGDDDLATTKWRNTVSCLSGPALPCTPASSGATTRSRFLADILSSLGKRTVRVLYPVGDASVVERFAAVILVNPPLPQAVAFNEHCRAVGCAFIVVESRGPVGRLFRDFGGDSRSLREALLSPLFTTTPTRLRDGNEAAAKGAAWEAKLHASSSTTGHGCWSAEAQQRNGDVAVARADYSDRQLQHHICLQALHVFQQEHGHLPLPSERNHAEEVVRIAEELVEMGTKVSKGLVSETEFLDKPMCLRVAALARFSVPAVVFLLGGLAASEIHHWVNSEHRKDTCDGACWSHEDPTVGSCRPNQNNGKWFIVDELDAGCDGDLEGNVLDRGWNLEEAGTVLDPRPLRAWLGPAAGHKVKRARVALIGCNRLGRDLARCLALSEACTGSKGRVVFIDSGDASRSGVASRGRAWSNGSGIAELAWESDHVPGRAAILRGHMSGTGPGLFPRASSFDGLVQDTNADFDLWEGVEAVVVCVGREVHGTSPREAGGCEALLRFVCHKCVLHGKPLVWGWADGGRAGSGGVEVMAPGRTSCLVCRHHGGFKELVHCRTASTTSITPTDNEGTPRPSHAAVRPGGVDVSDGRDFGIARSAVAGLMVIELVKLLVAESSRTDLRNWTLGNAQRHGAQPNCRNGCHADGRGFLPSCSTPDPPRAVFSREFDPLSGDTVRAVPEGFTEWGVDEIKPWDETLATKCGSSRNGNHNLTGTEASIMTLRALARILLARFGVEVKSVAAAAPGSECRASGHAAGAWGRGVSGEPHLLWAEWEKETRTSRRGRQVIPKMDQRVTDLWKRAIKEPPSSHRDDADSLLVAGLDREGTEPRFLFLDIRGMIGEEVAELPVFKYWILADLDEERRELVVLGRQGAKHNGRVDSFGVTTGKSQAGRPSPSLACISSRTTGFEDLFFFPGGDSVSTHSESWAPRGCRVWRGEEVAETGGGIGQ